MRPRPTLVSLVIATALTAAPIAPTVAVAAPRAAKDAHSSSALQRAVVRSVNAARARHRLPPVRHQARLARAASAHSIDQLRSGQPSHRSADGTSFDQRLRRYSSARSVGETIVWLAPGQPIRARTVVRMWMASPSHRRVLMDRRLRRIGIGARSGTVGGYVRTVVTANFSSAR
ncbi:MAG: CAP domain-containing protein [Actinobacteria bacterium]|nr:CAP domain-containing protein [Actinomycetota bacterium]